MHVEIERKFLLANDGWRDKATTHEVLRDGLIATGENGKVRVRIGERRSTITVKSARTGLRRNEFEYEIPRAEAETLLAVCCAGRTIVKTRYWIPHRGSTWEVDVYAGNLVGLAFAEIELEHEDESFERPGWLGQEVTGDPRFGKQNLLCWSLARGRAPTLGELLAMPADAGWAGRDEEPAGRAA